MNESSRLLENLHGLLESLQEYRDRLERGPRQIAARENQLAQLSQVKKGAEDVALNARKAVDQKQLDLRSCEARIEDWKRKLNACSSNKEYQTLLEQIAAAEMANSVLEDEILEGLDKIENSDKKVHEAGKNIATAQKELESLTAKVEAEAAGIREDILRLESELSVAEKGLPKEVIPEYTRLVAAKGADGLSSIEDNVCTGCGQSITINMQSELKLGKTVLCKSCGRLIYIPA